MRQSEKNFNRIVVKIGSSLIFSKDNKQDFEVFNGLCRQIAALAKEGKQVVVVSSGAIALGMHELGLINRPKELHSLQAAAAIGQPALMNAYRKEFSCAQILLTWEDFNDRRRYLNAKNTLLALLRYKAVPVINENDTVSTDEIRFGDNDRLSALVASLISADMLVILSDVDGLMDKGKNVLAQVCKITPQIKALACPTDKETCVGGMVTKIEAAKIAVDSGIPCVIANGRKQDIIRSVINEPAGHGTLFVSEKSLTAKKRWIAFSARTKGSLVVDDGAKKALLNNKSLLSVGVVAIQGAFESGDIISVVDSGNCEIARGKINISSRLADKVKGKRTDKEIIHRDNIVIL